jgi:hypothetical protein
MQKRPKKGISIPPAKEDKTCGYINITDKFYGMEGVKQSSSTEREKSPRKRIKIKMHK